MNESAPRPVRLATETLLVSLAALGTALVTLRVRPAWRLGVIGGGDAWQNLWNLRHVATALRDGTPFFRSEAVWAPEGTGLRAHTLSLTNTLPGALLGRLTGEPLAYDLLVVLAFVLAAAALYRLARRLGAGVPGAAFGAFVFAFAPQHTARALGHLNLLGTGWIPLALEGLLVASRGSGSRRLLGALCAALALVLLVHTDWYLALLGALAAAVFALFELVRAGSERRRGVFLAFLVAAAVSLTAVLPSALALAREAAGGSETGHDAPWCSAAITSLVIPSRHLLVSALTWPLTGRNHQSKVEGAAYLGLVPLALTLWIATGRRRPRDLDAVLVAGGLALLLALGPNPRLFDQLLPVPLPYWFLEKLVPALRLGGCVNRFLALAFLPLALGSAFAVDRLRASGRGRLAAVAAALVVIEYAPRDPGVSLWPFVPPDPAMEAIARSDVPGSVLDVDPGSGALIRQLTHGRPQTFGYLSKVPARPRRLRLDDPVTGPFLDLSRRPVPLPRAAVAELLRDRWGVAFVVAPDSLPLAWRAWALGLPLFARDAGRSVVFLVPNEAPGPVGRVAFAEAADPALGGQAGLFVRGIHGPETLPLLGVETRGAWTSGEAELLAPLSPGNWALDVAAPRPSPSRVVLRWGKGREVTRTVSDRLSIPVDVAADDLSPDGTLTLRIEASTIRIAGDARELGVFAIALERR